jgi:GMP synthase (glutamine-hydrolysing)
MGGSMGIYDHAEHPWLVKEKEFIRTAIAAQKPVLGICLGAQLIADVLGTRVYSGLQKEIGWFPIHRAENTTELLPTEQTVFHWHGDTFDCPNGATCLASTPTCPNQGFIYKNHVVALQFHLETTPESMQSIIENSTAELAESAAGTATFQTAEQMQTFQPDFKALHNTLQNILHFLFIR